MEIGKTYQGTETICLSHRLVLTRKEGLNEDYALLNAPLAILLPQCINIYEVN